MWLGSGIAVAVVQASGNRSDSTPSLGTSLRHRCGPKKDKNKTKQNKTKTNKKTNTKHFRMCAREQGGIEETKFIMNWLLRLDDGDMSVSHIVLFYICLKFSKYMWKSNEQGNTNPIFRKKSFRISINFTPKYIRKKLKAGTQTRTCTCTFRISLSTTAKKVETARLSTKRWMDKHTAHTQ